MSNFIFLFMYISKPYIFYHLDSWQPCCPTSTNALQFQPLGPSFATDMIHWKEYFLVFCLKFFFLGILIPTTWVIVCNRHFLGINSEQIQCQSLRWLFVKYIIHTPVRKGWVQNYFGIFSLGILISLSWVWYDSHDLTRGILLRINVRLLYHSLSAKISLSVNHENHTTLGGKQDKDKDWFSLFTESNIFADKDSFTWSRFKPTPNSQYSRAF